MFLSGIKRVGWEYCDIKQRKRDSHTNLRYAQQRMVAHRKSQSVSGSVLLPGQEQTLPSMIQ